jgi:hypothetical protein
MWNWFAELSTQYKVLTVAACVVGIELVLRHGAPRSDIYRNWTKFFEGIGKVWTAVLLGIIYFLSVSLVSLGMRLFGRDLLDRALVVEPSFWRTPDRGNLDPKTAARHLF